jgi:hypothetical protein
MSAAFSTPYDGDFQGLAEQVVASSLQSILRKIASAAEQLNLPPPPLPCQEQALERLPTHCWRPELGAAIMGLAHQRSEKGLQWIAGQLQVMAFLSGILPSIQFCMDCPHPLSVAGHFLQEPWLALVGDPQRLTILDRGGKAVLELDRVASSGASPVWARCQDEVLSLGSCAVAVLNQNRWMDYWLPSGSTRPFSTNPKEELAKYQEAFGLLEEAAPEYYRWVTSVLCEMAFLERVPRGTVSGSFLAYPGHIQASVWTPISSIIVLIHECSHQYFNMLIWHGPMARPDAPEVWSVLKKTARKLDRVLIGFHAFGNVLLGLGRLLDAGPKVDEADLRGQIDWHLELVLALDQQLLPLSDAYLTDMGKAIYLPLRNRLLAAEFLPTDRFPLASA